MSPRNIHYARDGVPWLSLAEQETILIECDVALESIIRDRLTARSIRLRQFSALKERNGLFDAEARRGSTLVVASLRVLGWSLHDICDTLQKAGSAGLDVLALDIDMRLSSADLGGPLLRALVATESQRRRNQTAKARGVAVEGIRGRPRKMTDLKMIEAKSLWPLESGLKTSEIAERVGIASRTLYAHLGRRSTTRTRSGAVAPETS